MTKKIVDTIYKNEKIKRGFFENLQGAKGYSKNTVSTFSKAISLWQNFLKNEDFMKFNKEKALEFVEWLRRKESRTKTGNISIVTLYNYVRRVKKFFGWLHEQPIYRSKIKKDDIEFLRLSKRDTQLATCGTAKTFPTIEEVKKIIGGIEIKNEIDMRDRALICFTHITGMRISAIITLRMKNFDPVNRLVDQNPNDGVLTKNFKRILTAFFPIEWKDPEQYFIEWYNYLKLIGNDPNSPIFPATLKEFSSKHSYSKEHIGTDFWKGASSARKIFKKRCNNVGLKYFNPHLFRHLIVNTMSKIKLTEEEKRAISLNLGHENIGTTFGSHGYGSMNNKKAVEIVQGITIESHGDFDKNLSDEEKRVLLKAVNKISK